MRRPYFAGAAGHKRLHAARRAVLGELSLEAPVDLRRLILVLNLDAALPDADVGAALRDASAPYATEAQRQVARGCRAGVEVLMETALGWHHDQAAALPVALPGLLPLLPEQGKPDAPQEDQVRARISSQMSSEERATYADVVVENDGDIEALQSKVEALWKDRLAGRGLAGSNND